MNKKLFSRGPLLALGIGLVLVILLFNLPQVVVDDKEETLDTETSQVDEHMDEDPSHDHALAEDVSGADSLKSLIDFEKNQENSITFANSLAERYQRASLFDSSAYYYALIASYIPTEEWEAKAGDAYFNAYNFAIDKDKQMTYAAKAQEYYGHVLERNPSRLDVKTNLAMTYIGGSNPMQGVMALREVLESNPQYVPAIYNMGMLSVQSGQYKKALTRFEELVRLEPNHLQGQYYLAICYLETGNKQKAKAAFLKVKELDDDPEVQATVDSYLADIE